MKKAIFSFIVLITISTVTNAQAITKANIKGVAKKAADATDKEFGLTPKSLPVISNDTLDIPKDAKFIKLNGKLINIEVLDKAILVMSDKDVDTFLNGVQEYPAKIANPFTQYFLKFFGLTIGEPKK